MGNYPAGARHIFASAGSGRSSDHARRRTTGHNVGQLRAVALQLTSPRPAIACSRSLLAQKSDGHPNSPGVRHIFASTRLGPVFRPRPMLLQLATVWDNCEQLPCNLCVHLVVGQLRAVVLQYSRTLSRKKVTDTPTQRVSVIFLHPLARAGLQTAPDAARPATM